MRRLRAVALATALLALSASALLTRPATPQAVGTLARARETVLEQLAAFRRDDFDAAYAFASATIRERFDRDAFERMIRGGYPEIARSVDARISWAELAPNGNAYLELRIRGANGTRIEALYELVWEHGGWRINAVVAKPDPSERT